MKKALVNKWWWFRHRLRYSPWRPKWIAWRFRETLLTLKRGYSTFVLDEFDHHFNEMAIASLQYHLSEDCVADFEDRRDDYEKLIERLSEPFPDLCDNDEERAIRGEWPFGGTEKSPELRALFDRYHQREEDWTERQQKARHDFIDILRELWS